MTAVRGLTGLIAPGADVVRIATGATWSEGPCWIPDRRALRWSDIPGDRILEWSEATGDTSVYAAGVEFTNGRTLDDAGSVIQCSHGRRRVERDTGRRDPAGRPVVEVIADSWNGRRFNSPNDVVVKRDGTIWFTDPPYGIIEAREGHPGFREYGDHWVFRVDETTGDVRPVVLDVEEPNGLAFSPDESVLYVADSSSVRKPEGVGNRHIRAYDVVDGIRCKNSRVFATIESGFADGIRVDRAGNVWSSSAGGVEVFAPSGEHLGGVDLPELTGNLCFGGVDGSSLFIAASTSIYGVETLTGDARRSERP
ncbi:SMP-30/gluconolactonase/LRE family protein [Frondihabitans australicus]|uniref:Gluconolactonase n=1 Tax=Frondihabitans australicus TaxID=386892 RepID=A0A495IHE0_9MICO|nr:SMP-30/gluconolactonase/LRE family protein [Frondihabitans australicus]RKR75179.1 gluconolactonase [Frondihabitans australicus]